MIAAVQVRGNIDTSRKVENTLENLNLGKRNRCVILKDNESIRGILQTAKDYITYGEISEETVEKLEDRKEEEIKEGDTVDLSPPSGGYRNTKKQVGQNGSLGKRDNIDSLITKMV
ncbi:MAG: uL30 family ribosomal protein [Candidatus Nanohaloarchaea archaeon]